MIAPTVPVVAEIVLVEDVLFARNVSEPMLVTPRLNVLVLFEFRLSPGVLAVRPEMSLVAPLKYRPALAPTIRLPPVMLTLPLT